MKVGGRESPSREVAVERPLVTRLSRDSGTIQVPLPECPWGYDGGDGTPRVLIHVGPGRDGIPPSP